MKKIILESLEELRNSITEKEETDKKSDDKKTDDKKDGAEGESEVQQDRIYRILSNNLFNHSEVAKQLWGKNEATERSLFRKKLNKMTNDSGGSYSFSPEEMTKISSILMNASNQVRKELGKHTTN